MLAVSCCSDRRPYSYLRQPLDSMVSPSLQRKQGLELFFTSSAFDSPNEAYAAHTKPS